MLLSKKLTLDITDVQSNIIAHMGYAAYKLWNVCNYEKKNYKALGLVDFPNWYYQKKAHKANMWYKSLPSQIKLKNAFPNVKTAAGKTSPAAS